MTRLEKAVANLEERDITAKIENDTVYVSIGWTELQLSDFEIDFQAKEFDEVRADEVLGLEADSCNYFYYKGKDYRLRVLLAKDEDNQQVEITLAPISLYEAMGTAPFEEGSDEEGIDDSIYFYLDDELIDISAEEICEKHLDIKFTLIDEL